MVVEWHEREHEEEDDAILGNPEATNALLQCGLLNFFKVPNIKAQKQTSEEVGGLFRSNR